MKRKIKFQKIFNVISIIFLSVCALIYGFRFLTLYIKNVKKTNSEANTLGSKLKKENKDILKKIDNDKYFYGKVETNYVTYSGILWRAIKIADDNTVTLISDNALTVLAYGAEKDYDGSYITTWLNKGENEASGIVEKNMNNYQEYIKKGKVCNDKISAVSNTACSSVNEKYYFNTLTATDYVNTGASESFINNGEVFYLSDMSDDNQVWFVNSEGKVGKSKGTDLYGVKVVINLKEKAPLVGGKGTKEDPYIFDSTKNNFGSYVKLGEDIYRVIGFNDTQYKLVYDGYIKDKNGKEVTYRFSSKSAYFDDTVSGSAAYYMNTTFLNSLSYKNVIVEAEYPCGYYGSGNNYDYTESYKKTLKTKVGFMSIGDIILNHELTDYFLINSSTSKNTFIYTFLNTDSLFNKSINSTAKLVPVITINKEKLVGVGTKDNPYRLETN